MYDFLDSDGVQAVLEAVKGKIPASLPANGGNADYAANADKLDGLHATDFAMARNSDLMTLLNGQSGDIRALVHQLSCGGYIFDTNYPQLKDVTFPISGAGNLSWSTGIFNTNGYRYGILIVRPMTYNGDTYICSVYNNEAYTDWQKISDGGNADTVDGLHADDFYSANNKPYVTGSITITTTDFTITTNHNFTPSAVLWWKSISDSNNIKYEIYSATGFTDSTITIHYFEGSPTGTNWVLNYIIFR